MQTPNGLVAVCEFGEQLVDRHEAVVSAYTVSELAGNTASHITRLVHNLVENVDEVVMGALGGGQRMVISEYANELKHRASAPQRGTHHLRKLAWRVD